MVDFPCVPDTAIRRAPRVAAASAMSCWQLIAGMPASRAATSSGRSGSTDVRAFETAIRSTIAPPPGPTTWAGSCRHSSGIPASETAGV